MRTRRSTAEGGRRSGGRPTRVRVPGARPDAGGPSGRSWPLALALGVAACAPAACGVPRGASDPTAGSSGGVAPGSAPAGLPPGDHELSFRHRGRARAYLVHVPESGEEPRPVLLAFHGGGGDARQFRDGSGFDALADAHGFLSVHPQGTGRFEDRLLTWNAGACCGYAADEGVDDVGFASALVDHLAARTPVDRNRIYATGHSNGAMLAYRLAAEAADRIAAIAAVGGAMNLDGPFRPTRPVAVLHIHSVDDPRALYEGGSGPPFPLTRRRVRHNAVEEELGRWIRHDGCPVEPEVGTTVRGRPGTRDEGHAATRHVWAPCDDGVEVHLLRLEGAGHGWPGAVASPRLERIIGPSTTIVDAAAEAWGFVSRFVR